MRKYRGCGCRRAMIRSPRLIYQKYGVKRLSAVVMAKLIRQMEAFWAFWRINVAKSKVSAV